jgi:TPR repeat protein
MADIGLEFSQAADPAGATDTLFECTFHGETFQLCRASISKASTFLRATLEGNIKEVETIPLNVFTEFANPLRGRGACHATIENILDLVRLATYFNLNAYAAQFTAFRDANAAHLIIPELLRRLPLGAATDDLEGTLRESFVKYAPDPRLLQLPVSLIQRVFSYPDPTAAPDDFAIVFDFLVKSITTSALFGPLLRGLEVAKLTSDQLDRLDAIPDLPWGFLGANIGKTLSTCLHAKIGLERRLEDVTDRFQAAIGDIAALKANQKVLMDGIALLLAHEAASDPLPSTRDVPRTSIQISKSIADAGAADAQFAYGVKLMQEGKNWQDAVDALRPLAEADHALAQYRLGMFLVEYSSDRAALYNLQDGVNYLKKAGDQGVDQAALEAARILKTSRIKNGPLMDEAEKYFKRAVELGNVMAMAEFGQFLIMQGKATAALPYLKDAAEHDNVVGLSTYGTFLRTGEYGVPRDLEKGAAYLKRVGMPVPPAS